MFIFDKFLHDCIAAASADASYNGVLEIFEAAFVDPDAVLSVLGEPQIACTVLMHRSPVLTMSNVVLSPGKSIRPHNHGMWSIIGIYEGREDSVLWRPLKRDFGDSIEPVSALSMSRGDVLPFGSDVIHSVTNPTEALSGAIHVYGGDFFDVERSEWDSEHLTEHICDLRELRALFG